MSIETFLSALGLKKALAGLMGGAISGAVLPLPGPLAALGAAWKRIAAGMLIGALIAHYAAAPLARWLERPDDLQAIAFGLGVAGLSIIFKVVHTWNDLDLGGLIRGFFNRNGGNS